MLVRIICLQTLAFADDSIACAEHEMACARYMIICRNDSIACADAYDWIRGIYHFLCASLTTRWVESI